jgi:FtsP/CotA-like multicopper oxidase with cupredoxin domain
VSNLTPGTYLYESGTEPHLQVHMGLYGALIVRPAGAPDQAYAHPSTAFSEEFILILHEVDPIRHQVVERGGREDFDTTARHDRYWFVNGRNFPDDTDDTGVPWFPYQPYGAFVTVEAVDPDDPNPKLPVLIRYLNAGTENHPFHPHGNHMQVIGRDGRRLLDYYENFNTTIGAGQTYDLLFQWRDVEGWENPVKQIPATIPGLIPLLLNLVFKDDGSFYSGDPYLGDTGDFPAGTVVDNECGEFYFPWHSHALNEFQNFDEGFGGMATLVRVDPPDGCP